MNDFCKTTKMVVLLQDNGIIRLLNGACIDRLDPLFASHHNDTFKNSKLEFLDYITNTPLEKSELENLKTALTSAETYLKESQDRAERWANLLYTWVYGSHTELVVHKSIYFGWIKRVETKQVENIPWNEKMNFVRFNKDMSLDFLNRNSKKVRHLVNKAMQDILILIGQPSLDYSK